MVYAKDMVKVSMKAQDEEEKKIQEILNKDAVFTREFCHSTLSRMVEDAAQKGNREVSFYVNAVEGVWECTRYGIVEKSGSYWKNSWKFLNLATLWEIVTAHEYKITDEITCLKKSSTKMFTCRKITIAW